MQQIIHGAFFPDIYFVVQRQGEGGEYVFELKTRSKSAVCPCCGTESNYKHSYQNRIVRDLPIFGKPVSLLITQAKYFCNNEECTARIFTERNGLVSEYSQFTERCREYMLKVATHVSCEATVKILAYQGIRVCGDTLLNMIKAAGAEYKITPGRKIGVDDWAYRKGQAYGTIICDLETHEIVEVLKGRDGETFEKWLSGHPGINVVSRDRASAYASAVNKVLPEAIQIADRFHITKNLLDALNDTMKAFMPEVVEVPIDEAKPPEAAEQTVKKTQKRKNVKSHN